MSTIVICYCCLSFFCCCCFCSHISGRRKMFEQPVLLMFNGLHGMCQYMFVQSFGSSLFLLFNNFACYMSVVNVDHIKCSNKNTGKKIVKWQWRTSIGVIDAFYQKWTPQVWNQSIHAMNFMVIASYASMDRILL